MVFFPNAKINIGLFVTGKRPDGYHNIQSVLYPVPLYDMLELLAAPDGNFGFSMTGTAVEGEAGENLVVKAWRMLKHDFGLPPVHIHLHKTIPTGAGLGGGSADAAFVIRLIDHHFKLNLSVGQMKTYAGTLGMDCPFFIGNSPATATQRGDQLAPAAISLKGKFLVLVKPGCHISTSQAYRNIEPARPKMSLTDALKKPVDQWKYLVNNDFEKPVFAKFPEIKTVKERLYSLGAEFALMSGSGSAVFAIFNKRVDFRDKFTDCFYYGAQL